MYRLGGSSAISRGKRSGLTDCLVRANPIEPEELFARAEMAAQLSASIGHRCAVVDIDAQAFTSMEADPAPLVMYLVPKRALAAEVESKLQRTIAPLSRQQRVVITGLYGGIDWGPTDAWLTADERTVLICTYEKAEALIRFLGPLFLGRLALVVLDEAHMVRYDGKDDDLRAAESRPLRLESLVARLLTYVPADRGQVIALSAVAAGPIAARGAGTALSVAGGRGDLDAGENTVTA